jgi:hypothetical protein
VGNGSAAHYTNVAVVSTYGGTESISGKMFFRSATIAHQHHLGLAVKSFG